ncbi:MAG: hypothetical protein AAF533_02030 [Acidobacteriota bacterium]
MATLIKEKLGQDVTTTASKKAGEFSVWVDEKRVLNKFLVFKPSDEKVLAAVEAAVA